MAKVWSRLGDSDEMHARPQKLSSRVQSISPALTMFFWNDLLVTGPIRLSLKLARISITWTRPSELEYKTAFSVFLNFSNFHPMSSNSSRSPDEDLMSNDKKGN